ncbi:hypothetical protein GCM10007938_13540 [Vibrio zhanjiangensis]|uniref:Uncharacterized protein n=1 Tax=Vibrio zhanjiangensis TaxID=1046128 RepID=A0ABQ6EXY2_9VIBR|nr:hypothetical protein GCM10007938_13540 [Vibrio zhanjiangensis]
MELINFTCKKNNRLIVNGMRDLKSLNIICGLDIHFPHNETKRSAKERSLANEHYILSFLLNINFMIGDKLRLYRGR